MRLYRHKEQLKKDILKKRVLLEKELQIEIQKELATELAARTQLERVKQDDSRLSKPSNNIGTSTVVASSKRKTTSNITNATKTSSKSTINPQPNQATSSTNEKIKVAVGSRGRKCNKTPMGKKKEKLYCICRTPFDDSK